LATVIVVVVAIVIIGYRSDYVIGPLQYREIGPLRV
jgi:Flp pilus assembly pilin Flp